MRPRIVLGAAAAILIAVALVLAFTVFRGERDAPRSVNLTMKDDRRTVQVRVGDTLVVMLDSNASTGFRWMLTREPDPNVLELVGSEYVAAETTLVGAGGQELWRFHAVGEGSTDLRLTYERSWSGETGARPFDVTVEVTPAG
jgi:predicted secreted protein